MVIPSPREEETRLEILGGDGIQGTFVSYVSSHHFYWEGTGTGNFDDPGWKSLL